MKVLFHPSNYLTVEIEGDSDAALFKGISEAAEIFTCEDCGICKAGSKFVVRKDKEENEYFELQCTDFKCRGRLSFGQQKKPKGKLYPKRRWASLSPGEQTNRGPEPKGGYLPNNGWYKWTPKANGSPAPAVTNDQDSPAEDKADVPF